MMLTSAELRRLKDQHQRRNAVAEVILPWRHHNQVVQVRRIVSSRTILLYLQHSIEVAQR